MTPNELRELADRMLNMFAACDSEACGIVSAYLREQADRQEQGAVAWRVRFNIIHNGRTLTDSLIVRDKEQAERQIRADLITAIEPLYLHPAPQSVPIGWLEGPHGALRANPDYRFQGPQAVAWSFPLYLHPAPQSVPAGGLIDGAKEIFDYHGTETPQIVRDVIEWFASSIAASPAATASCIGSDPTCPCQDGDACHFRDAADGTKGWPIPAPADVVEALRELVALKKMKIAEISDFEMYSDRYAKAWQNAKAALAAADQKDAMQRATDIGQDLGLYELKETKCD